MNTTDGVAYPDMAESADEMARNYLNQVERVSYASLRASQEKPWPSIGFGAAGIAYALWRTARECSSRLDSAEELLREAAVACEEDYLPHDGSYADGFRSSLYYGPLGISFVRALVARGRGDEATYALALSTFLAGCREANPDEDELLMGIAGLLNGLRILDRAAHAPELIAAGDAMATQLLGRARGADNPGSAFHRPGFAHGIGGALHALLAWSEHVGKSPSRELRRAVDLLAAQAGSGPSEGGDADWAYSSWCNGVAGRLLLWVKAYEVTGEERFRALAEEDGVRMLAAVTRAAPNLCCGSGGQAYACLALDRIDPGRGWASRARQLANRNARMLRRGHGAWPHGLLKGYPGFACLMVDLASPPAHRTGFPLVES